MTQQQEYPFDRATQDVGNIVELGHVNTRVPDQGLATLFYVTVLGLTRDPYLNTGTDNMWINVGRAQFHLPTGPAQVLRGVTGLVVPDIAALGARVQRHAPRLGADFGFRAGPGTLELTCPWGNRLRCHAPDPARFGPMVLGMPYVEIDAAPGSAEGIVRFYRQIIGTPATSGEDSQGRFARVPVGLGESLVFRETDRALAPFDGHHIQIALADFSGPHGRLRDRGLITEESSEAQYRFETIVDPETGAVLATIEHEVRSMRHPMYARPLVNRNAAITAATYLPGHEQQPWT